MVEGGPRDKAFILSQSERAVLGTGPPSRSREGTPLAPPRRNFSLPRTTPGELGDCPRLRRGGHTYARVTLLSLPLPHHTAPRHVVSCPGPSCSLSAPSHSPSSEDLIYYPSLKAK